MGWGKPHGIFFIPDDLIYFEETMNFFQSTPRSNISIHRGHWRILQDKKTEAFLCTHCCFSDHLTFLRILTQFQTSSTINGLQCTIFFVFQKISKYMSRIETVSRWRIKNKSKRGKKYNDESTWRELGSF